MCPVGGEPLAPEVVSSDGAKGVEIGLRLREEVVLDVCAWEDEAVGALVERCQASASGEALEMAADLLERRGWHPGRIEKVLGTNWIGFFREVWGA